MGYDKCKICKKWHWDSNPCDPEYKVYEPNYMGDDAEIVRASSFDEAATEFAAWYNTRTDYSLMNKELEIEIEDAAGKRLKYIVSAEPSVHYSSTLKD